MKKLSLLAASVALVLVGCGGGSGGGATGGDTTANNPVSPGKSTSSKELATKLANVNPTVNDDANICGTYGGIEGAVLRTEHFKVGVMDSGVTDANLEKAARVTQVAFNDLLTLIDLDAETDLHIDESNPWVVCVDSKKTGNGAGHVNAFEFSPENDAVEDYRLAKHELTHTVTSELLGDVEAYLKSERWFDEGIAHNWGSPAETLGAIQLADFTQNVGAPAIIKLHSQTIALWADNPDYSFMEYASFSTVIDYMIHKLGVTKADLLDVIRKTKDLPFEVAFNTVMSDKGLSLTLSDLEDPAYIQNKIIDGWLVDYQATGSIVADVNLAMIFVENDDYMSGSIESVVDYSKGIYESRLETFKDGTYELYALDSADKVYGPVNVTVKNHAMGNLNLTGIPLCTSAFCSEQD
ncbi:hypothetical protein [Photobacterium lipolyticum]|uniref:Lipoprotein n=1 Tax=Photobacterium lipolyticum TaxID=266810 RepID=A0A2T3N2Y4_9GAMM|nr:hypothetical protein [Photobacterium lipolyticum]PSW06720.1 hypothetical protein C9I89_04080 [Photobacterium lipolyticum]